MKKITNVEIDFGGSTYPDFEDAFICYAEDENGRPLTDDELDELNDDSGTVYEFVLNEVF